MSGDTFGHILQVSTAGESHGHGLTAIISGVPAGLKLSEADLQTELDQRKPGQGATSTSRCEADLVHITSGLFEGQTTGTAIALYIVNQNQHSQDYDQLADIFRPGHADYTYFKKFGLRDHRGGGRASGRETALRVAAGAIAQKILDRVGITVLAGCIELGGIPCTKIDLHQAQMQRYFAASPECVKQWDALVEQTRASHDTLGGIVQIEAYGMLPGLGEPVFDKLSALLAHGLMSVGAVKGIEIGDGFASARHLGSVNNDALIPGSGASEAVFTSNHAGGILGGISSGQNLVLRCAVKPIASIGQTQKTINTHFMPTEITIRGRHDLSAIPRIVPVLKAMTRLVLADCLLMQQARASLSSF